MARERQNLECNKKPPIDGGFSQPNFAIFIIFAFYLHKIAMHNSHVHNSYSTLFLQYIIHTVIQYIINTGSGEYSCFLHVMINVDPANFGLL